MRKNAVPPLITISFSNNYLTLNNKLIYVNIIEPEKIARKFTSNFIPS